MEEQNEVSPTIPASLARANEQWLRKGKDHYDAGRDAEALKAFEEVIRLDPRNVEAYYYKSVLLRSMRSEEENISEEMILASQKALNISEEAILDNPTDADAYCFKGLALFDLGRYEEAVNAYEQALLLDPSHASGYYHNIGNAFACLQRDEEAINAYEQALRLDPHAVIIYRSIGDAFRRLGQQAKAQQADEKVRELSRKPSTTSSISPTRTDNQHEHN